MNLLRRIASLPVLRSLLLHPGVRRRVAALLSLRFLRVAWSTTTPGRFVLNDLVLARHLDRGYALHDGSLVMLRHRRDTEAFHELYLGGEYDPPAFLGPRLSTARHILDIGGNVGMFAHWAARKWPDAHVVSLEPAPENTATFRAWLARSGADIDLVEACAMTTSGTASFTGGSGAGSQFAASTGAMGGVAAVDILSMIAEADLVKMDIEGGEWPILGDARLAEASGVTLVLEYHRRNAPSLPARLAAEDLLQAAGFKVGFGHENYWGHGTLWAWKD